jgi:hypothetical protein
MTQWRGRGRPAGVVAHARVGGLQGPSYFAYGGHFCRRDNTLQGLIFYGKYFKL